MQQMAYFVTQNTDVAKAFFTLQMAQQFYGTPLSLRRIS